MNGLNLKQLFFVFVFLRLLAAHSLYETYFMRGDSDFPYTNSLRVSFFQQKVDHFFPNINKNLLFEVIVVFCFVFFRFHHM